MLFTTKPKGKDTIANALATFTKAQDELKAGIAQSETEAAEIKTQIEHLNTELFEVNNASAKAQAVHDNISKLLEN
jgi:predicted  nucleic acid-binding Zn-ribbon protein